MSVNMTLCVGRELRTSSDRNTSLLAETMMYAGDAELEDNRAPSVMYNRREPFVST